MHTPAARVLAATPCPSGRAHPSSASRPHAKPVAHVKMHSCGHIVHRGSREVPLKPHLKFALLLRDRGRENEDGRVEACPNSGPAQLASALARPLAGKQVPAQTQSAARRRPGVHPTCRVRPLHVPLPACPGAHQQMDFSEAVGVAESDGGAGAAIRCVRAFRQLPGSQTLEGACAAPARRRPRPAPSPLATASPGPGAFHWQQCSRFSSQGSNLILFGGGSCSRCLRLARWGSGAKGSVTGARAATAGTVSATSRAQAIIRAIAASIVLVRVP